MRSFIIALVLLVFAGAGSHAQNILVIDYNNAFNSDRSNGNSRVYNYLVSTQPSVTRIASIPAAINPAYDQVWIYGNMGAPVAATLNPVINYINGGGAVYVQSEVSCCNNAGAFVEDIIQACVIGGGGMSHLTNKSGRFGFQTHATANCPSTNHYGSAVRPYVNVPNANQLFQINNVCGGSIGAPDVAGVMFRSCDMVSGQGAFCSTGDFNMWIPTTSCGTTGIVGSGLVTGMVDLVAFIFPNLLNCSVCTVILPTEISYFDAERQGGKVVLNWETAQEMNNEAFIVERSTNLKDFHPIATIPGKGDSQEAVQYSSVDYQPLPGLNYYRLKQKDIDGGFSYSEVRTVNFNNVSDIYVHQQTGNELIVVDGLPDLPVEADLLNTMGQTVGATNHRDGSRMTFSTMNLAEGVYFVRVRFQDGSVVTKRLFVR